MPCDVPRASAEQPSLAALLDLQSLARAVVLQAVEDVANGSWPEARAAYAWLTTGSAVQDWVTLAGFRLDVSRFRRTPLATVRRWRGSALFAELRAAA